MHRRRLSKWLVVGVLCCPTSPGVAAAQNWTDTYIHQSDSSGFLEAYRERYLGQSRSIINLAGEWQARKAGENAWHTVRVPGAYDFEGEVEFKRTFTLDSSATNRQWQLELWGVNNRCQIFLNNTFLASHSGGQTAFRIALDRDRLRLHAANEIRIIVNNQLLPRDGIPLVFPPRFSKNYGGIFRDIFILSTHPEFLQDVSMQQRFDAGFTTCVLYLQSAVKNAWLESASPEAATPVWIRSEIWDPEKRVRILRSDSRPLSLQRSVQTFTDSLEIRNPQLWSPDRPKLFELRVFLFRGQERLDEFRKRFGFRAFSVDSGFRLNGQILPLAGFDWMAAVAPAGSLNTVRRLREQVQLIKRTGANAVRILNAPPHPYFLDLCDEAGLLVLEQIPAAMLPDKRFADVAFVEQYRNYVNDLVRGQAWHASFAALGLGEDLTLSGRYTRAFVAEQFSRAGRSHPLLFAGARFLHPAAAALPLDFLVVGLVNKTPSEIVAFVKDEMLAFARVPVMLSIAQPLIEFGDAVGRKSQMADDSGSRERFPGTLRGEEIQAYRLSRILNDIEVQEAVAGRFVFTFSDWQSARPNILFGPNDNACMVKTGIVDLSGRKRIAYDVVKSNFNMLEPVYMSVRLPAPLRPNVYPVTGILLILFFLFHFNRNRKFRGNLKRVFVYPHGFYTELRENRKVPGMHTFVLSVLTCVSLGVVLSSLFYYFRYDPLFDELLNLFWRFPGVKRNLNTLILNPLIATVSFAVMFYLAFGLLIFFLKLVSRMFNQRLQIVQFATLVFWTAANFIWMLPLVPIYYRMLHKPSWVLPAMLIVTISCVWFFVRLLRGLRVLYALSMVRTLMVGLVLVLVTFGSLAWYYEVHFALFDYVPLYTRVVLERTHLL